MITAIWAGHTDRSRATARCIREAIAALGWKEGYAAHLMKISPAQLSRQLAGADPLNLWRLSELPDEFWAEYDKRRAGLRGATVLEAPDLSLIRGACALGEREMLQMVSSRTVTVTLPLQQKRNSR